MDISARKIANAGNHKTGCAVALVFSGKKLSKSASELDKANGGLLKINPLVFGAGIPLFRRRLPPNGLDLVAHQGFDSGHLILQYKVDGPTSVGA